MTAAKRKYTEWDVKAVKELIDARYTRDAIVRITGFPKVTVDRMARANGWHFNGIPTKEVKPKGDLSDVWNKVLKLPIPRSMK